MTKQIVMVFENHYRAALQDSCFAAGTDPATPPNDLSEALKACKTDQAMMAVYATFAKRFDKAYKEIQ